MSIQGIGTGSQDIWSLALKAIKEQESDEEETPESVAGQIVSGNDEDGDGMLSMEEMGFSEEDYAELDTDGDGLVSADEIAVGLAEQVDSLSDLSNPAAIFAHQILALFDTDGDSMLDLEESGISADIFVQTDTDGDGLLSAQEIAQSVSPTDTEPAEAVLSQSDSGLPANTFSEIDTNGDGFISQSELTAWMRKSQTNLAEIMSSEDGSTGSNDISGLFTTALERYQNQVDSIMQNLQGDDAGTLNAGLYGRALKLDI